MIDDALKQVVGTTSRLAAPAGHRFVEGRVRAVTAAGMTFTVPGWDKGKHVFGPAPWPASRTDEADLHVHPTTTPAAGDRCLVLLLGSGVDRPWVVGWWPA